MRNKKARARWTIQPEHQSRSSALHRATRSCSRRDIGARNVQQQQTDLKFRCPAELEACYRRRCRRPEGLEWLKTMPADSPSARSTSTTTTPSSAVRPSSMLRPAGSWALPVCDLRIENGKITWDHDLPPGGTPGISLFADRLSRPGQVSGTPLFEAGRFFTNSTICGPSKRRKATRSTSRIRSTASTRSSPRS